MRFFKSKRKFYLMAIDVAIMLAVYFLFISVISILHRVWLDSPLFYIANFGVMAGCLLVSRILFSAYSNVWRYANSISYLEIVLGDVVGGIATVLLTSVTDASLFDIGMWQTVAVVAMITVLTLSSRFCYQILYKYLNRDHREAKRSKIGVAIVGAGQVGALLAEELIYNTNSHYNPICFIDRDPAKTGSRVCGIEVLREGKATLEKLKLLPVQEIFIAITKITSEEAEAIHRVYAQEGFKVKIYDFPIREDETGEGAKRVIREFRIEDLLFRGAIKVYDTDGKNTYKDKTVIVTGGGGSIGSELCRQVAACSPKKLIIFDIYENNAYDIQQELARKYKGALDLSVEIGSVRDVARLEAVFNYYRPDVVFHAAAHKHVPLMEHSNCEAIKNNVIGTYNTANAAEKYGVKKFILISTDKAVNPTNVMGASKRMCEMVVQCRTDSKTIFAAVRFGNVLGSNGSVIPLFKRQIEAGGPVTITDKRIIRYFMTIPEAAGLVMQAGAMAKGGDLFVLDMGKPVKILELAENMIRLTGLKPYVDIPIVETGLRPGEKLYEELLIKTEELTKTENDLIFIEHDAPLTREAVEDKLALLRQAVKDAENEIAAESVKAAMKKAVPTFYDPEDVNKNAAACEEMKMAAATN